MMKRTRISTWLATAVTAVGVTLAVATPAPAAPGDFATGFETGDPQPTWQNSVEATSGIAYDQPLNTDLFRGYFDDITISADSAARPSDLVDTRRGSNSDFSSP
jgi:hypothetical protein